jgi:hypothetical protein
MYSNEHNNSLAADPKVMFIDEMAAKNTDSLKDHAEYE